MCGTREKIMAWYWWVVIIYFALGVIWIVFGKGWGICVRWAFWLATSTCLGKIKNDWILVVIAFLIVIPKWPYWAWVIWKSGGE